VPHAPPTSFALTCLDIWGWVQIMKFLIVQLPPFPRHLIPLRSKYSSQTPSVYALPLTWETKFHTHNNNNQL
jgi:hypothetical protein